MESPHMIREKIISIAGRSPIAQAEWTSRPLSLKHVAQPGSVPASRGFNRTRACHTMFIISVKP